MFNNKTLAITGGTGSFGNHLVNYFLKSNFGEIRIFSRDEKKQEEMRISLGDKRLKFYIGDVRDYESLHQAFKGVDYVYHAAALKQVPSCEFYPLEELRTNVLGADNVIKASIENGVKRVVLLSTDKAVYPINAMGQTKALMEKVMISRARMLAESETLLCATRYGNVMGSRGSVIPLFISQVLKDRELTVTDPSMTRFLMSLDDSVALVLHAFKNGVQGDIFVQKSPASTIGDLATAIKEIFNYSKPLRIIGTRHGEKLYESLISREEMAKAVDEEMYYRIPADNRDLNYAEFYTDGKVKISEIEDYTSHNTERLSLQQVKNLLIQQDFMIEHLK